MYNNDLLNQWEFLVNEEQYKFKVLEHLSKEYFYKNILNTPRCIFINGPELLERHLSYC